MCTIWSCPTAFKVSKFHLMLLEPSGFLAVRGAGTPNLVLNRDNYIHSFYSILKSFDVLLMSIFYFISVHFFYFPCAR